MKWALVGKPSIQHVYKELVSLHAFLKKKKQQIEVEETLAKVLKVKGVPLARLEADIFVSVGGDGTVLLTLKYTDSPILAINAGGTGFLSEVEPKYSQSAVERILRGDYRTEERAKLACYLQDRHVGDAANEVTLQTARIAKLIKFRVDVNGDPWDTMRGDGIIVSTSTGSTGYSLSVGGPILHPNLDAVVISPIAPFRLVARPLVIPFDSEIRLTLLERTREEGGTEAKVVVDGRENANVPYRGVVRIKPSKSKARFIRFNGGFYQRVRTKLTR